MYITQKRIENAYRNHALGEYINEIIMFRADNSIIFHALYLSFIHSFVNTFEHLLFNIPTWLGSVN